MRRLRAILARAARAVAFDDEQLGAFAGCGGAVDELAGEAEFLGRGFARGLFSLAAAQALFGAEHQKSRIAPADFVSAASQLSKWSRTAPSTMRCASTVARRSLVWPTNSGSRMKQLTQRASACGQIFAGDLRGLLVADKFAVGADALEDGGPEAGLMRAAFGVGTVLQ